MGTYQHLPGAELEVMQALWRLREYPADSAALMAELTARGWRLPTLIKLLSRLEERGFVVRSKSGRGNLYRPLVAEADYLADESKSFLDRLHGGSLPSLAAALVAGRAVSEAEIAQLEEILRGGQ